MPQNSVTIAFGRRTNVGRGTTFGLEGYRMAP
jgi:hypothetical protein